MTRNGIINYLDKVDITKKDKNQFVYNASVSKGMVPLVERVWPLVKQRIPQAKLKVIGGFYKFKNGEPDEQELKWRQMVSDPIHAQRNIEFTGIIRQNEIAEILAKSSFMIYPGSFPETFGISTLESLNYNTPLITTRFGALEETAIDRASYFVDYAIEPNNLFPDINTDTQVEKFVEAVMYAYNNDYLHQQKMYYCNVVKDVCDWSTIALQWKQHLFKKLGLFLSVEDYRKVSYINDKVHRIYGRRFSNPEEWNTYRSSKQNRIVLVTPFFNAKNYLKKCIDSVLQQDYENYRMFLINDASTDDSVSEITRVLSKYSKELTNKVTVISNTKNVGALKNQVDIIRQLEDDDIVFLLDGDDWLINDNNVFNFFNNMYNEGYEFTYGSCWSVVDNIPLISQPYPEEVKERKSYRQHKFNWNIPYSHLRTFRKRLINQIPDSDFKNSNDEWYRAGGDISLFYSLIENAEPSKIKVVQEIVYNYHDASPLNDYKINGSEQTKNANEIIAKRKMNKKILIAIPTAKYVETATFKSIYDLDVPEGYETELQFFYGYQIDQIRNLIANWAIHYDYLFSVDSDIVLPKDTLTKMINHNKDLVSGLYIQRKPGEHILEIYFPNQLGGVSNVPYDSIKNAGLIEIAGCGFGCVLVKSEVIRTIGYPQFVYKSALDHNNTVSEDVYFCAKAKEKGFKLFADTSILCDHIGSTTFKV
jgi:glycosyltransferase involved in cell wall biosynthesis